jgi:hypothetical protein
MITTATSAKGLIYFVWLIKFPSVLKNKCIMRHTAHCLRKYHCLQNVTSIITLRSTTHCKEFSSVCDRPYHLPDFWFANFEYESTTLNWKKLKRVKEAKAPVTIQKSAFVHCFLFMNFQLPAFPGNS